MTKYPLHIIPARGGSKGIPRKNIKPIHGKPLICHSIDIARTFVPDEWIVVSTDDEEIIGVVEKYGLKVSYKRPSELATDASGMSEVIEHVFNWCASQGLSFDKAVLLQPTSPFRKADHVSNAMALLDGSAELVTSVKIADANPYYLHFKEDSNGYLEKILKVDELVRRQDAPLVYELNGAVYAFERAAFEKYGSFAKFEKIRKVVMDRFSSLDLDTMLDWEFAEFLIQRNYIV
jgi:N-acylneuraminate cytidylyltransferase